MTGSAKEAVQCRCCIVGGGPAGMMLGLLLARAGVRVLVLEKHADFLRDFRGDTLHPSTLEIMEELGLRDELLARPHQRLDRLQARVGGGTLEIADFSGLPTAARFIAMMPQWDFLDLLAQAGRRFPDFELRMRTEAVGLRRAGERVTGVTAETPTGTLEVTADLTVAADGRNSLLRDEAALPRVDLGAPMDVLWFRLPRAESDPGTLGHIDSGRIFLTIDRGTYWQCAFVVPKGAREERTTGELERLKADIAAVAAPLADRIGQIRHWDDVKRLTVRVDRLLRWHRPGFLCIGDAAHAMSPIGGVGINLALHDAVAAANLLAHPLAQGKVDESHLARVQRRRELPTRLTQAVQLLAQRRVVEPVLRRDPEQPLRPPLPLRLLLASRFARRLLGRAVGLGYRPEHVSPTISPTAAAVAQAQGGFR